MPETILVTGATGTVGRHVIRQLVSAGAQVRAGARGAIKPSQDFDGVEPVMLDLDQPVTLDRALSGVDRVFLSTPLDERMVERSARLIDKARDAGVRHIVRLSAMGVDFDPPIRLGEAHGAVEREIEASGIAYTMLRPNSFMQNYLTYFGETVRRQSAFYLPQGEGRVSLVDVRDIAAVAVHVLSNTRYKNKTYELTGPAALSNLEIADVLSKVTGRRIAYVDVSERAAQKTLREQGLSDWLVGVLMELYLISREGRAARLSPGVTAVLKRPPTSFDAFAADHAYLLT